MTSESQECERRIATQLLDYWNQQRGERAFPTENDIDPDAISDIWDNCFMVQARDISRRDDYNYSYLGKNIINAYRGESMDTECLPMIGTAAGLLGDSFEVVIENKSPMEEDGEFLSLDGKRVQFRQCLLPLGEDTGRITAVFGGLSLRILANDEETQN